MNSQFLLIDILSMSVTPWFWRCDFSSSKVQRESSEIRTTPFDVFRDKCLDFEAAKRLDLKQNICIMFFVDLDK